MIISCKNTSLHIRTAFCVQRLNVTEPHKDMKPSTQQPNPTAQIVHYNVITLSRKWGLVKQTVLSSILMYSVKN